MAMQSFPRPDDRAKRKWFERGEKREALMPCLSSTPTPHDFTLNKFLLGPSSCSQTLPA